jgi:tetratricopeptide (TPR) repeat protein
MTQNQPASFLEMPSLLERSQPQEQRGWFWYAAGVFLLIVLIATWAGSQSAKLEALVRGLSGLAMLGVIVGMSLLTWRKAQGHRDEARQVASIEELVQLRRWSEAAQLLDGLLGRPMRAHQARIQCLIYLAAVLARYHRFDDAIQVQQYLLDTIRLDPGTEHGLRLGRAMAMLRADHLFDADRAINELRRIAAADGRESGGLALVEMYRDVKTGHPAEAVETFQSHLPAMRDQLGHRVGDAYALAAKAYDGLGRSEEARQAMERATLLSPAAELLRRYPEIAPIAETYRPATTPQGALA